MVIKKKKGIKEELELYKAPMQIFHQDTGFDV